MTITKVRRHRTSHHSVRGRSRRPSWAAIRPSLIDSEFRRFEVRRRDIDDLGRERFYVYIKLPDKHMETISCDACEGPHTTRQNQCTGNTPYPESSYIIQQGHPPNGGVFLYNLYTRLRLPGIYILDDLCIHRKTGSATLLLAGQV